MDGEQFNECISNIRKIEDNLSVSVKISHGEADRITVERLIEIRNANIKREDKFLESFDYVLRFFLTKDEYDKYVLRNMEIK